MQRGSLCFFLLLAGCGVFPAGGSDMGGGGGGDMSVAARFSALYGDYFSSCANCHAPNAPGRTSDIEQTLDFSTRATAFTTLTTGMAAGLQGNAMACNGVPFVTPGQPGRSLVVATLDFTVRQAFDLVSFPDCDMSAISDETVKVGSQPSATFLAALKQWISDGAADN
jgi:hypothetical protein